MNILSLIGKNPKDLLADFEKSVVNYLKNYQSEHSLQNKTMLEIFKIPRNDNGEIFDVLGIEADLVTTNENKEVYSLEKFDFDKVDIQLKGVINMILKGQKDGMMSMILQSFPQIQGIKSKIIKIGETIKANFNEKHRYFVTYNGEKVFFVVCTRTGNKITNIVSNTEFSQIFKAFN